MSVPYLGKSVVDRDVPMCGKGRGRAMNANLSSKKLHYVSQCRKSRRGSGRKRKQDHMVFEVYNQ